MITAVAFVVALSLDSFATSFAYGTRRIRIPLASVVAMSAVGAGVLAFSLTLGSVAARHVPAEFLRFAGFAVLLALGLYKSFDELIKSLLRRRAAPMLRVYLDPESADADRSRVLSVGESMSLAFVLSLDSLAAGVGFAAAGQGVVLVALALVTGSLAVLLGGKLGFSIAKKSRLNLSWLSGILLILLACSKL